MIFRIREFKDISYKVYIGDIFLVKSISSDISGKRPAIVIKVFPHQRRALVAPLTTNVNVLDKDCVILKSNAINGFNAETGILLSHMNTCEIDALEFHLGKVTSEVMMEISDVLGLSKQEGSIQQYSQEKPKILICGPHGLGHGLEILHALAHNISQNQKYEGIVLVDMPERPDLILKKKFQLYALKSIGVIVYLSDQVSGACLEFDWASELDILTVGIVANHLPTEMLSGINLMKSNVKLIYSKEQFPQKAVSEAIEWIDENIEQRIKILEDCC
ncbi:MAG: type II toxin-antitoxin system PemK/MazF family toxin [Clostridiaceae bacterium]|nr:type II toxin-antitoxin system PemK/MazF family toxin [Clostridiaceae bacterium]